MRSQEAAASLSSRTVICNRIEDFQQGKITWHELQEFTASRCIEQCLVRNPSGRGDHLIPESLQNNEPSICLFRSGDQVFLIVYTPIKGSAELLGWDVLVYPINLQLETEGEKRLVAWLTDESESTRLLAATENLGKMSQSLCHTGWKPFVPRIIFRKI